MFDRNHNTHLLQKLQMLVAELPVEVARRQCIRVVYDDAQDVVYVEVKLGDRTAVDMESSEISGPVFLVFQLSALQLLLESDPNRLQLWLALLDLREFYVYFTDRERGELLNMTGSLQEMGLRTGGVVLGVPAVEWDELMLCFRMSETGF